MSEKISQLTPHTPNAADVIPVADGGANFSDTVGAIESQAAALVVNITGTAVNLSGTPALPNGTTATTQITGDNTTKIATDAFVHASIAALPAETWSGLTGNLTETQVVPFDGPTPGTADTWISRSAAGTVAIGATSTPGNASGSLNLGAMGIGTPALPHQVIITEPENVTMPIPGLGAINAASSSAANITLNINVNDAVLVFVDSASATTSVTDNGSTSNIYVQVSTTQAIAGTGSVWFCAQAKFAATSVTANGGVTYYFNSGATYLNVSAVGGNRH